MVVAPPAGTRFVFAFDHDHGVAPVERRDLLGGKGASLAEMTGQLGLPVPPGFTVSTVACREVLNGRRPDLLDAEVEAHLVRLEANLGRRLGDGHDPLLVSVRSGAPRSMPGMMDTVLNLGMNDAAVAGLGRSTGDELFANDSYHRFLSAYALIVCGIPKDRLAEADLTDGVVRTVERLARSIEILKRIVVEETGEPVPQDGREQLRRAIDAVFMSWLSPRAVSYREREGISADLGTAVNVQAMVFGNRGEDSGTGVGFTRDPSTGEATPIGDFLLDAQGEDVVAGTHATLTLADMAGLLPEAHRELIGAFDRLERHFRNMLDVEFTVERGQLWLLQTRIGARTARAAVRMAVEMVDDHVGISPAEAVARVTSEQLRQTRHRHLAVPAGTEPLATGVPASPGSASGSVVMTADDAVDAVRAGGRVILVRSETSPDDVHGMGVAVGLLTARGGAMSHAAVVARGWGKPAVCGAGAVVVGPDGFTVGDVTVRAGDVISIDGATGDVHVGELAHVEGGELDELSTFLGWVREQSTDGADSPAEAVATSPDAAPAVASRAAVVDGPDSEPDLLVLHALKLKGFAKIEAVAELTELDATTVEDVLVGLRITGLVQHREGTFGGWSMTPEGRQSHAQRLASELAERGGRAGVEDAYQRFLDHNGTFKQVCTDWQVRPAEDGGTVNDHDDAVYDSAVVARLGQIHVGALEVCADLTGVLARFSSYGRRFSAAWERLAAGDQSAFTRPMSDSYHDAWMELHQDLLSTLSLERSDADGH